MRRASGLALALSLLGCDDTPTVEVVQTQLTIDVLPCLGDASGALGEGASSCRARLEEAQLGSACFVYRVGGGALSYLPLSWTPGVGALQPVGESNLAGAAGQDLEAALFFFGGKFSPTQCAEGGLQINHACGATGGCLLKLDQRAVQIAADGSTRITFLDGEGRCRSSLAMAPAERCDGVDDDCDGVIDEGVADGTPCARGAGACERPGAMVCDGMGNSVCDAVPGNPAVELCNGVDDDCDGGIDEGTLNGCGQCGADKVESCNGVDDDCDDKIDEGTQNACGACGPAPVERCNDRDDDCDGMTDEGLGLGDACERGQGVCRFEGEIQCDPEGATLCVQTSEPGRRGDEICDGLDNDCDGVVDEVAGVGSACVAGVGACATDGVRACDIGLGALVCVAANGEANEEICDGVDNDCDGEIDEVPGVNDPCSEGVGACSRDGRMACNLAEQRLVCSAVAGQARAEICDGRDDDCNGVVDDVPDVGGVCAAGDGVCERSGRLVCDVVRQALTCDARPGPPGVELCDAEDNDCDGRVDEDTTRGDACTVGLGVCARSGRVVCTLDGPECDAEAGQPEPVECDGEDNDCDGEVDPCAASLVINEIDYDQRGSDVAEFVEIHNPGDAPVSLALVALDLIGDDGAVLLTHDLSAGGEIPAGGFLVLGREQALDVTAADAVTLLYGSTLLANQTLGLVLRDGAERLDALSYLGVIAGITEGAGAIPPDPAGRSEESLARCGADTDQNLTDFVVAPRTPGAPNACN